MKKYVNAKQILPESLIQEIQKYVKGQHIYIPQTDRQEWGTSTGVRENMEQRNTEICRSYYGGISISQLAETYNISEERIRGIIYEKQRD